MHVSAPTRWCPHGGRHSYACIHMHAHKPFKNPFFFFFQLQLQPQPSVFCYGGLYSKPRLTCRPTSRWLTPGPQMEADLAGFAVFFFFFFSMPSQTPYHEDVLSELWPYKAGERLFRRQWGEEKKKKKKKKQQVLFFVCCHSASSQGENGPSAVCICGHFSAACGTCRGRLKAGSWRKKEKKKKKTQRKDQKAAQIAISGMKRGILSYFFHVHCDFVKIGLLRCSFFWFVSPPEACFHPCQGYWHMN